jgi:hypothetical protein
MMMMIDELGSVSKKRSESAEMKLLRPLAAYTLRGHKYNDDIRSELGVQSITEILDIYRTY